MNTNNQNQKIYSRRPVNRSESIVKEKFNHLFEIVATYPRQSLVAVILVVALCAFEIFNFDTTRFALENLIGDVNFAGLQWAAILAVAFCAIDFAGLMRFFTPEGETYQEKEAWYLLGAWLLGATMNAMMTWWAISLTLLDHEFGNEVLNRAQLLTIVPIFVAILVWLTRILFIGAFSIAGDKLLNVNRWGEQANSGQSSAVPVRQQQREQVAPPSYSARERSRSTMVRSTASDSSITSDQVPNFLNRPRQRGVATQPHSSPNQIVEQPIVAAPTARRITAVESEPVVKKKMRKTAKRTIVGSPVPKINLMRASDLLEEDEFEEAKPAKKVTRRVGKPTDRNRVRQRPPGGSLNARSRD